MTAHCPWLCLVRNGPSKRRAACSSWSRPTASTVRGVRMPCRRRATSWRSLLTSSAKALLPLTTRRPCASSQASTSPISPTAAPCPRVCAEGLIRFSQMPRSGTAPPSMVPALRSWSFTGKRSTSSAAISGGSQVGFS